MTTGTTKTKTDPEEEEKLEVEKLEVAIVQDEEWFGMRDEYQKDKQSGIFDHTSAQISIEDNEDINSFVHGDKAKKSKTSSSGG